MNKEMIIEEMNKVAGESFVKLSSLNPNFAYLVICDPEKEGFGKAILTTDNTASLLDVKADFENLYPGYTFMVIGENGEDEEFDGEEF